jgi:DNA-binding beta-propeller fold protein YncE
MKKATILRALLALALASASALAAADAGFLQGNFYATSWKSRNVAHYDAAGHPLPPLKPALPLGASLYGLTQGPDGLLYVTVGISGYTGFNVLALNSRGEIARRYTCHEPFGGYSTAGQIAFDAAGNFFVIASEGLVYFDRETAAPGKLVKVTGGGFYDPGVQALIPGPNGHFLLATSSHLAEATSAGVIVREIQSSQRFEGLRGIAYDAPAGVLYATVENRILKLDLASGRLLQETALFGGGTIVLASSGRLVVTGQIFSPQVFAKDLRPLGAFGGEEQTSLTEIRIGSPGTKAPAEHPGSDGGHPAPASPAPSESGFVRGDFYATIPRAQTIAHYDSAGGLLDPISLPLPKEASLGGLAQGPDGLLYVVANLGNVGFAVLAVNRQGDILKRYVSHHTSPGVLKFEPAGNFIVVTAGALVRFQRGDEASSTPLRIAGGQLGSPYYRDLAPLPNGNLLVALAYHLCEIRPDGAFVREIESPLRLSGLEGVAYDAATGSIYTSMSGYTGQLQQVLELDAATGELRRQATVNGASQIVLAEDGRIVVGSGILGPQILSKDLRLLAAFSGAPQVYVTQIRAGRSPR